jgi:hypothetical protein
MLKVVLLTDPDQCEALLDMKRDAENFKKKYFVVIQKIDGIEEATP